jgi:hypothetical protein
MGKMDRVWYDHETQQVRWEGDGDLAVVSESALLVHRVLITGEVKEGNQIMVGPLLVRVVRVQEEPPWDIIVARRAGRFHRARYAVGDFFDRLNQNLLWTAVIWGILPHKDRAKMPQWRDLFRRDR